MHYWKKLHVARPVSHGNSVYYKYNVSVLYEDEKYLQLNINSSVNNVIKTQVAI